MQIKLNSHIIVLLATFLVGGSFIVSKNVSGIIDPISITLLRFVIASIFLAPIVFIKKEFRVKVLSTFKRGLIISFFYSLFFIGMFNALEYTSALNTGTIFTLVPFITGVLSFFVFKQKINLKQFVIYLTGIIGTCIVVFRGNIDLFFSLSLNKGDLIFLASIFSMALYSISAKYFHKTDDKLEVLVFVTLVGGVIWMSIALYILQIPLQWNKIGAKEFSNITYLSIGATLLTSYLYQKATIDLGPKKVMSYIYLNPAAIALLMYLFENANINYYMIIGIFVSSISTFLLLRGK